MKQLNTSIPLAYGSRTRTGVAQGDELQVAVALASLAAQWMLAAGYPAQVAASVTVAQCVADDSPRGGLLAASLDLVQLLRLWPKGREALAQLGFQPVLEQLEAPRS